jgi:hypothetical protein
VAVGGAQLVFVGWTWMVRPPVAVVQRCRSGQWWQRMVKLACPDAVMWTR